MDHACWTNVVAQEADAGLSSSIRRLSFTPSAPSGESEGKGRGRALAVPLVGRVVVGRPRRVVGKGTPDAFAFQYPIPSSCRLPFARPSGSCSCVTPDGGFDTEEGSNAFFFVSFPSLPCLSGKMCWLSPIHFASFATARVGGASLSGRRAFDTKDEKDGPGGRCLSTSVEGPVWISSPPPPLSSSGMAADGSTPRSPGSPVSPMDLPMDSGMEVTVE